MKVYEAYLCGASNLLYPHCNLDPSGLVREARQMETNNQILNNVLNGEKHAFRVLVDEYQDLVFTLCCKIVKDREVAEEAAQDTFVKVYRKLHQFDQRSSLKTWIYRIAYRTAIDYYRKTKREYTNEDALAHVAGTEASALDRLENQDQKAALQEAITSLKPADAAVLNLYYFEELNLDDVAKIMNFTVSNAKVRLHRARKRLGALLIKTNLEEYGY